LIRLSPWVQPEARRQVAPAQLDPVGIWESVAVQSPLWSSSEVHEGYLQCRRDLYKIFSVTLSSTIPVLDASLFFSKLDP